MVLFRIWFHRETRNRCTHNNHNNNRMVWKEFIRPLMLQSAKGAFVTFGSMTASLAGAVIIERSSHRFLYRHFPHWYLGMEHVYGLEPRILEPLVVQQQQTQPQASTATTTTTTAMPTPNAPKMDTVYLDEKKPSPIRLSPDRTFYTDTFPQQVYACALTA